MIELKKIVNMKWNNNKIINHKIIKFNNLNNYTNNVKKSLIINLQLNNRKVLNNKKYKINKILKIKTYIYNNIL